MSVRILAEAEDELEEAMLYYEDRRAGLGDDFRQRVSETIQSIARQPLRFPEYEGKRLTRLFRRALVTRFPYIVVYEAREDETLIVAVAHTSREPGYWGCGIDSWQIHSNTTPSSVTAARTTTLFARSRTG
jgi:plasmid stabilization system protein ParE